LKKENQHGQQQQRQSEKEKGRDQSPAGKCPADAEKYPDRHHAAGADRGRLLPPLAEEPGPDRARQQDRGRSGRPWGQIREGLHPAHRSGVSGRRAEG